MKKILIVLVLLISSLAHSQVGSWLYVSALPSPNPSINSLYVVNAATIWVAASASTVTNVYLSTNAGTNWILRNGGIEAAKDMYGIFAFDATTALVGSVDGDIYKTTNGGNNWTKVLDLTNSFTDGIYMFNTNYGIYYADPTAQTGQPYQLRVTTNGGNNWTLVPNSPVSSTEFGVINAWDWTDSSHVWIGSANTTASSTFAKVYRTTTGFFGTWLSTSVTGTGGTNGCYYQAVAFANNLNGMVGSSGSNIKKTTDGGATYTTVTAPSALTGTFAVITMNSLKDASNTIRMSTQGDTTRMFRTTNFGTTWIREGLPSQATATGEQVQHIQFINATVGFAVLGGSSGNGGLLKYNGPDGINSNTGIIPSEFKLEQNFPNPFNPATTIRFSLPKSGFVTLKIYDALGKEVETLVSENMSAGIQEVSYDASRLNSGVYFYRIYTNGFTDTKKMVLVK
jgi:photosystem II stability/assembly factor-like uncharacterized protein